ncbi:MAG: mechanosensitive ion channel protein MscS [Ponticaulis sp.]|nr:mechanosensitive ion channel protein MscS [Ponticaulis sp.]
MTQAVPATTVPDWVETLPDWGQNFYSYVASLWEEGVFGLSYGEVMTAIGVILLAFIIRGLFARTAVRAITRAAAGTKTSLDDALVSTISAPLKLVPIIVGVYIATVVVDLPEGAQTIADQILRSMVAISVFWTFNRAVGSFSFLFTGLRETLSGAIVDWLVKTLQVLFLLIGVAAVLDIWGIPIGPIIAGLGVFGIAVGLGAQDLFQNLIAGILILTEKRFQPGEWIAVDGVCEGTVEKINFRSTLIRRFDKSPMYVPNSKLSDNAVTNFSRMTHRRIKWAVGVEYRTTVEQLKYIRDEIEAYLWESPDFAKPPSTALFVRVDAFNASSIDFLIYTFTNTTNWGEWLELKEKLALEVMDIIEKAGTGFAFPSRTLYMQQQDPPEIMSPPELSPRVERARIEKLAHDKATAMDDDDGGGE